MQRTLNRAPGQGRRPTASKGFLKMLADADSGGTALANPYEIQSVEFTGYVTSYNGNSLNGLHLATGFANTPAEPYVVRARFLNNPALRVGANVWPEPSGQTSLTAFDDYGNVIDSIILDDWGFTGLEVSPDSPIRYVEWRGLAGTSLSTFPRVDHVMVDFVPEPATMLVLGLGALGLLIRRRRTTGERQNHRVASIRA